MKSQLRLVAAVLFFPFCAWTFVAIPAGATWLAIELHAYRTAPASPELATNQTVPFRVCRPHGGPCRTVYVTELAATTHTVAHASAGAVVTAIAAIPFMKPLDRLRQTCEFDEMAKFRSSYVCQNCGAITQRWQGKCKSCGEWNTIIEEAAALGIGGAAVRKGAAGRPFPLEDLSGSSQTEPRLVTGIGELDRVAGGGFVPGSATLIGGEPGIGKSTLLIQACAAVARAGGRVVYVSGEESTAQVRLRAARLGLAEAPVQLAAQTFVEDIVATLGSGDAPKFVVIDSIQTMWSDAIESAPGTVSQVRGASQALIRFAKASGAALLLVGHVTKDGQIAGPRVVEHMVDAVFSFEGDGAHAFRLLRAAKNRFGATDEVGVFEMTGGGLAEVPNPSALFLADRDGARPSRGCGLRRGRRGAAASGRDPGLGRANDVRHAPARGCRLGGEPIGDGVGRARGPRRHEARSI